jgi:hypothetical protein
VVYRASLTGGLAFPEFESGNNRFAARVRVEDQTKFKEFIRRRGHVIQQLDEIIVMRVLWAKPSASVAELCTWMERKESFANRVLTEMQEKFMVEPDPTSVAHYRLTAAVRRVIENIFQDDQMSLDLSMWGEVS